MFPIVHYYANKFFDQEGGAFLILGGLFPDLASSAGINRDEAHQSGESFYHFCYNKAQDTIPLARGILGHGVKPFGMDYYADEFWPGGKKGWCFQEGEKWIQKVGMATALPEELWYWKAHNFVEMALDLLVYQKNPHLKNEILSGLSDAIKLNEAAVILGEYHEINAQSIKNSLKRATEVFSIADISPLDMAKKQASAFKRRHMVFDADIYAMSELLQEISHTLDYQDFLSQAVDLTGIMLKRFPDKRMD